MQIYIHRWRRRMKKILQSTKQLNHLENSELKVEHSRKLKGTFLIADRWDFWANSAAVENRVGGCGVADYADFDNSSCLVNFRCQNVLCLADYGGKFFSQSGQMINCFISISQVIKLLLYIKQIEQVKIRKFASSIKRQISIYICNFLCLSVVLLLNFLFRSCFIPPPRKIRQPASGNK